MIKKNISHPLVTLFILYLLAYGFILINNGVWWDDWCLYNMKSEGIKDLCSGIGSFYLAPIHIFLQGISSHAALVYHFLAFVLYFLVSVFLFNTLQYFKIDVNMQLMLSAFFTVLPINIARIYMCCFHYTLGIFFCFAGIFFFTVAYYKKQFFFRLAALICSFLSFAFLPSTYVFIPMYIVFLVGLNSIIYEHSITENLRSFIKKILKYSDFFIITLLSWSLFKIFAKPTGVYAAENYNAISWQALLQSPIDIVLSYIENLIKLTWITTLLNNTFIVIIFVIIFVLLLIIFCKKTCFLPKINYLITIPFQKKTIKLSVFIVLGFYFFIAGSLAYIAVGKSPISMHLPNSRYQTLLGLGISLTVLGFVLSCFREKYLKYVFIFLLSIFITNNIEKCLIFQRLHYKNVAFMEELSEQETILNNRNFMLIDITPLDDHNASFYTFQGMAKKTFGDETRFIITKEEYSKLSMNYDSFKRSYNMNEMQFNGYFDFYMIIEEGDVKLRRTATFIKLMIFDLFNKDRFFQEINNVLTITCLPYPK